MAISQAALNILLGDDDAIRHLLGEFALIHNLQSVLSNSDCDNLML